jgi:hypothetical protein
MPEVWRVLGNRIDFFSVGSWVNDVKRAGYHNHGKRGGGKGLDVLLTAGRCMGQGQA